MPPLTVNIHEAKTQLSKLLALVEAGEEVVIARAGKPIARLVSSEAIPRKPLVLGLLKGVAEAPRDFDAPLPDEVLDGFEGR